MASTTPRARATTVAPAAQTALVPVMTYGDVFATFDRMDEDLILREMRGDVLSSFVYSFKMTDGNTVSGLSYVGVKEAARYLGGISTNLETPLQVVKDEGGERWMCVVRATDAQRALSLLGTASQPTKMKLKSGAFKQDDFAAQKALSKAQRNAIRALLSEELALKVIAEFTKSGKVRHVQHDEAVQEGTGNGTATNGNAVAEGVDVDHFNWINQQLPEAVRWSAPVLNAKLSHDAAKAIEEQRALHATHHKGCSCFGAPA
ncbi:MAG TPA: hypothetical protein VGU71_22455 [Candidatus Dormibacteraeota bacterium]|nr:hypothetical protein [Candidatus Dormibacteraeota bacterium]